MEGGNHRLSAPILMGIETRSLNSKLARAHCTLTCRTHGVPTEGVTATTREFFWAPNLEFIDTPRDDSAVRQGALVSDS